MKGVLRVVLARRGYTVESPLRAKYSNILKTVEQIITKVLVLLYLTAGTAGIACGDAENQGSMKHEVHYGQSTSFFIACRRNTYCGRRVNTEMWQRGLLRGS